MNTSIQLPTDGPVDLSRSRILFIDDQDLDAQVLQALATLQQPMLCMQLSCAAELLTQLHQDWDLIIYGQCEALTLSQSLEHIQEVAPFRIPVLIALPQAPQTQDFAHFLSMIRYGVFDLLRIDQIDHIQASLLRALKYSRALQRASQLQRQLEQTQKLNQLLQLQLNHARALIQDGVHTQVNLAYLRLFGLHDAAEILGQLLIDVLQPQHRAAFEQQLKQLYLENQAWHHFRIHSLNPKLKAAPELDLIGISQPEVNRVEVYILPTALLQTTQPAPEVDLMSDAQYSLSTTTTDHAANDQHYEYPLPLSPSASPAAKPQHPIQITALKQHHFDISQLNLPSSAILDLGQQDRLEQPPLQLYFQQLYSQHPDHALMVVVGITDLEQQQKALEAAAQQPFRPVAPQLGFDPNTSQQTTTALPPFELEALQPEQSYTQRLIRSIQADRELVRLSCQQLAELGPKDAQCMLILQLQHHILLHDPDFAHMLIHSLSILCREQPVLILEFDAPAVLLNSDQSLKRFAVLRQCGVLIALRNVQPSAALNALIQATAISFISFTDQLNQNIVDPVQSLALQQQIQALRKIRNVKIMMKNINSQDRFDHAIELDVDVLQGDYFQVKHNKLTLIEQTQPH